MGYFSELDAEIRQLELWLGRELTDEEIVDLMNHKPPRHEEQAPPLVWLPGQNHKKVKE